MPTFYIPLAYGNISPVSPGGTQSGPFIELATGLPLAVPQSAAPNILQRWTLTSIYAPYAIQLLGALAPIDFQLGISALINETPVWSQQANGQLFGGGPVSTSQVLAGDLFNPLDLNAGQKLTFAWQLAIDVGLVGTGAIVLGGRYTANGIEPVPGVVNYDVAYHPALGRAG